MSQKKILCTTRAELVKIHRRLNILIQEAEDELRALLDRQHEVEREITFKHDGPCISCENDHWPHCTKG